MLLDRSLIIWWAGLTRDLALLLCGHSNLSRIEKDRKVSVLDSWSSFSFKFEFFFFIYYFFFIIFFFVFSMLLLEEFCTRSLWRKLELIRTRRQSSVNSKKWCFWQILDSVIFYFLLGLTKSYLYKDGLKFYDFWE